MTLYIFIYHEGKEGIKKRLISEQQTDKDLIKAPGTRNYKSPQ